MPSGGEPCLWSALPHELQSHVLGFLEDYTSVVIWRTSTGQIIKLASATARWLCRCEQVCKSMRKLAQAHVLWSTLDEDVFPLITTRCKDRYQAWRQLYNPYSALQPVFAYIAAAPKFTSFAYGYRAFVEVFQPSINDGPAKRHAAFKCSIGAFTWQGEDALIGCAPFGHDLPCHLGPGTEVPDENDAILHRTLTTCNEYEENEDAGEWMWPPILGNVIIERSDGKVASLGRFDFSTPHCLEDAISGVNDRDGHSLHQVVLEPDIAKEVYGQHCFLTHVEIVYPLRAKDRAYLARFDVYVLLGAHEEIARDIDNSTHLGAKEYMRPVLDMFQRMSFN